MGTINHIDNFLYLLDEDEIYSNIPLIESIRIYIKKIEFVDPLDFLKELKEKISFSRKCIVQEIIDELE